MPNELLRGKAEALLSEKEWLSLDVVAEMTPEDTQLLFQELRVYQIELEMQNEELRRSQLAQRQSPVLERVDDCAGTRRTRPVDALHRHHP